MAPVVGLDLRSGAGRLAALTSALPQLPFPGLGVKPRPAKRRGCGNYGFASSAPGGAKPQFPRHVIHYRSRSSPDPMAKRKEGTSPSLLLVPVVGLEPTRCRHQRILSPSRLPFHHTGVSLSSIYHSKRKFKRKRFAPQISGRTGKKCRRTAASSAERKAEIIRPMK